MQKTSIETHTVYERMQQKPKTPKVQKIKTKKSAKVQKNVQKCRKPTKVQTCKKNKSAKVQTKQEKCKKTRHKRFNNKYKDPGTHQSRQCLQELSHIEVGPFGGEESDHVYLCIYIYDKINMTK